MAYKVKDGYKAVVYDNGYVNICELVNGEWRDCIYPTLEEAEKAEKEYHEFWKGVRW